LGYSHVYECWHPEAVTLDGIGFQMHFFTSFDTFDELPTNFAAVA